MSSKNKKQRGSHNLATISESEVTDEDGSQQSSLAIQGNDIESSYHRDEKERNVSSSSQDMEDDSIIPLLWSGSIDGWQLSWPIWHMLPRQDRKNIAHQHGYKSIGEFEENMSLQQAVDHSEMQNRRINDVSSPSSLIMSDVGRVQKPYPNQSIYGSSRMDDNEDKALASVISDDELGMSTVNENGGDNDNDEDNSFTENDKYKRQSSLMSTSSNSTSEQELQLEELMAVGGKLLMIHDDLLHKVFAFLPVDTYGTLALVSPHWKHFTRTEHVYKRLCERLYLYQSKKRQLHVSRFGGSYRKMLEIRPRIRAGGGCYVLKYSVIKPIQRDMWTEVPAGAILESIYYRYLYFQEDGRVLYALSSAPPHEMFRRLFKVVLHKTKDPAAVWGTFQVQKTHLSITAQQEWHTVRFDMTIHPTSEHGRFAALSMDRHLSSPSASFEDLSRDRVEYIVPLEMFRFVRDPRL